MNARAFGRERRDFALSFRWGKERQTGVPVFLSSLMNFEFVVKRFWIFL